MLQVSTSVERLGHSKVPIETAQLLSPMVKCLLGAVSDYEKARKVEWQRRGLHRPCGCWFFKKYRAKKRIEKYESEVAYLRDVVISLPPAVDVSLLVGLSLSTTDLVALVKIGVLRA